jgi:thioredoxin 1
MKYLAIGIWALLLTTTNIYAANLPKLIDVGADKCIPCIKMAPILAELKQDFSGQLEVEFIDAWKNRDRAASYGVQMIPTQIFYAIDGTELYRHSGFLSRAAILSQWRELGYDFQVKTDD